MPSAADPEALPSIRKARQLMATYADMEELIRLGAYKKGADPLVDEAIALNPALEAFLGQGKEETTTIGEGYVRLAEILAGQAPQAGGKKDKG